MDFIYLVVIIFLLNEVRKLKIKILRMEAKHGKEKLYGIQSESQGHQE